MLSNLRPVGWFQVAHQSSISFYKLNDELNLFKVLKTTIQLIVFTKFKSRLSSLLFLPEAWRLIPYVAYSVKIYCSLVLLNFDGEKVSAVMLNINK